MTDKDIEIERLEIAVQAAAGRAVSEIDGETVGVIDLLKRLRTAYGIDTDENSRKSQMVNSIAGLFEMFAAQAFKTTEQRAADKQAKIDAAYAADSATLRAYFEKDGLHRSDPDTYPAPTEAETTRANEILASRKSPTSD